MTLNYTVYGQARITMFSYIEEILTFFEKADTKRKDTNPSAAATNNIFVVNEDSKKLS